MEKNKKKINGYEKMEIVLEEILQEEILQEGNIDNKIKEMEEQVKVMSEENVKVQGQFKSKEEYEKALEAQQKNHDKEKASLEKKLGFYKAFAENKDSILNIREYQLQLQGRLEQLEKNKAELDKVLKSEKQVDDKINKAENAIKEAMTKIEKVQNDLKNPNLSKEEKEKLQEEKNKLTEKMSKNQDALLKAQQLKNDDLNKDELKKLEKSITDTKIKISKCNMIWSNLLKGKKWDDISVILTTGNFTSKDGKITKIKNLLKINNEKEVQAEVEEEVENGLAKNVKDILGKVTAKGNEILNKKEEKEEDNKLPVEVKSFEERHPKLAKIPFLAKFMNWRETKKLEKQGKQENKENNETQDSPKTEVVDKKALEYIDKQMKTREEEMFKSIAEKGFRESIKADVSERLAKQKVEAANKYAEKYGTKYKEQDGAEK